jgi:UDP-N-acetylmuramoylalanine--D-glutamate ligase
VVLFSPGATSFGMFANEFDRGRRFKEAVRRVAEGRGSEP